MDNYTSQPKLSSSYTAELFGVTIQAIHKQAKSIDIKLEKQGAKSYFTHDTAKEVFKMKFNKHKFAFQIVKGGTGKTTALHNISCAASLYGARVLVVDLDPQGNITDAFNVHNDEAPVLIDIAKDRSLLSKAIIPAEEGIDIISSRIDNVVLDSYLAVQAEPLQYFFNSLLEPIEDKYDYIFIDCPPTMGHSVTAAALYVDTLVVPLNPDRFSAKGLNILRNEMNSLTKKFKRSKMKYKVFLNKYSGNTILSDKAIQTTIAEETENGNALTTAIRFSQEIPNATDMRLNLFSTLKKSTARVDFETLTRELLEIDFQHERAEREKVEREKSEVV